MSEQVNPDELVTVVAVRHEGYPYAGDIICRSAREVADALADDVDLDVYLEDGVEGVTITLTTRKMTRAEFDAMPEFGGY